MRVPYCTALFAVLAGLAGLAACGGATAPVKPHSVDINVGPTGAPVENALPVSTTDITSDGRVAKIRGRVSNPYSEPVDGVRYIVTLRTDSGPGARTLDSFQEETSVQIAPGSSAMMRLDLQSMYFASASGFSIIAVPRRLGGRDIPPPAGWK